jgi:hypothetical protein
MPIGAPNERRAATDNRQPYDDNRRKPPAASWRFFGLEVLRLVGGVATQSVSHGNFLEFDRLRSDVSKNLSDETLFSRLPTSDDTVEL